jgi:hypothetical protein
MENNKGLITGVTISFKELEEAGFDRKVFTYFVEAIFKDKNETIVLNNCKAIDTGEKNEEIIYYTEGNDGVLIFTQKNNPNMQIKRIYPN